MLPAPPLLPLRRLPRWAPLTVLLTAAQWAPAHSQALRDEFWVPDSTVNDIAVADGMVFLGGDFTQVGPAVGGFVGLDQATGAAVQPFPGVAGDVHAVISDGADGWFIGGLFSSVSNAPRANLAHLDAAGMLTAWNPGADGDVLALARDGTTGVVYAGGFFSNVGGAARQAIAAIAPNGSVTAWDPGIPSGSVHALLLFNGTLYSGGSYTSVAGQPRRRAAAFDPVTGGLGGWNPDVGEIASVDALAARLVIGFPSTVTVYLGGSFSTVGGQPRANLAAVDGSTGAVAPWNPGASGWVNAIALAGGSNPISNPLRIYVGGSFQTAGGAPRRHLAELNEGGGVASWNPDPDNIVFAVRPLGNLVFAGGQFTRLSGTPGRYIAAIDRTTGAITSWDPMVGGSVRALAVSGSSVFAGGDFFTVGGVRRNRLAALDLVTGLPTAWDPGADAPVRSLVTDGTTLYIGGVFTQFGGQTRRRLAAVDVASGALTGWDPDASSIVSGLVLGNGVAYVTGAFTTVGGQVRAGLASIDLATGLATPWNPAPTGVVSALTVNGSSVYVGGSFTAIGGQSRSGIAKVDAVTGLAASWNPNAAGKPVFIQALATHGQDVYVGGSFDELGGRPRENLAVIDATTGLATGWDPYADFGVLALAPDGESMYVGGGYNSLTGVPRAGLAALNVTTGMLQPWQTGFYAYTRVLTTHQGSLYVAPIGKFGSTHGSFAVFSNAPTGVDTPVVQAPSPLRAWPNPFRSEVALQFTLPRPGEVDVSIYDLAGRFVRRLSGGTRDGGTQQIAWDGRDDAGQRVGAGVYLARVVAGSTQMTAKVLRLE